MLDTQQILQKENVYIKSVVSVNHKKFIVILEIMEAGKIGK